MYRCGPGPGAFHLWESFRTDSGAQTCAALLRDAHPGWCVLVEAPESEPWGE